MEKLSAELSAELIAKRRVSNINSVQPRKQNTIKQEENLIKIRLILGIDVNLHKDILGLYAKLREDILGIDVNLHKDNNLKINEITKYLNKIAINRDIEKLREKSDLEFVLRKVLNGLLSLLLEKNIQEKVSDRLILQALNRLSYKSNGTEEKSKEPLKKSINYLLITEGELRQQLEQSIKSMIQSKNLRYLNAQKELMDSKRVVSLEQSKRSALRYQKGVDSYNRFCKD